MSKAAELRRRKIAGLTDLSAGRGLEIGPLDKPIALSAECDVHSVDVYPFEALRARFEGDPGVDVEQIVRNDYSLTQPDGSILTLSDAVRPGGPYSWAIASHVVEHVPDLIGWLADIAEVMAPQARLILAIPDRRFTFDVYRPQTTVGQILQAHFDGDRIPSSRAIYDYLHSVVTVSAADLWQGRQPGPSARIYTEQQAIDEVHRVRQSGDYVDAHVWMFTPGSFVEQIAELGRIGFCPFVVDSIVPTATNELEFYAVLRKVEPDTGDTGLASFDDSLPSAPGAAGEPPADPGSGLAGPPAITPSPAELRLLAVKRTVFVRARKLLAQAAQVVGR